MTKQKIEDIALAIVVGLGGAVLALQYFDVLLP